MIHLRNNAYNLYANANVIIILLTLLVHMICALSISKDLNKLSKRNIMPQLMSEFSWIIAVLINGIWGLLVYWIIHHSTFSRK